MGRPKKVQPAPGGAVTAPESPTPVREQIKNMSGFANLDELRESVPESTAVPTAPSTEKVPRKRRTRAEMDAARGGSSVNMEDQRYADACANMAAFGGARGIKNAFKTAAVVTQKPSVELTKDEAKVWDDFFYVVSKKSNIDVGKTWYLITFGLLTLFEHVMVRVWQFNQETLTAQVFEFFGFGKKEEEKKDEEAIAA
jgi:hypothetical protein